MITVFALAMMTFPLYSNIFFSQEERQNISNDHPNLNIIEFKIDGMTCTSCEDHIEHAVNKLSGIVTVKASYENSNAIVEYDSLQTSLPKIQEAIGTTGYTITSINQKK